MTAQRMPPDLQALGRQRLPERVLLAGDEYRLDRVFKHDFFAATARYIGPAGKVVVKIGRKASFLGMGLEWIGRLHAWHEAMAFGRLADLDIVPRFAGRVGQHGFAHAYVEGRPLAKGLPVPDDFFERLRAGLALIHARGMAYVDLEKCENVLCGDDGRPYLVDFQISFRWPWRWGGDCWPVRYLRRRLQEADLYHLRKLQRRVRPDQLDPSELAGSFAKPESIRVFDRLSRPLRQLRRRILARIDPRSRRGERGRIDDVDEDVRASAKS